MDDIKQILINKAIEYLTGGDYKSFSKNIIKIYDDDLYYYYFESISEEILYQLKDYIDKLQDSDDDFDLNFSKAFIYYQLGIKPKIKVSNDWLTLPNGRFIFDGSFSNNSNYKNDASGYLKKLYVINFDAVKENVILDFLISDRFEFDDKIEFIQTFVPQNTNSYDNLFEILKLNNSSRNNYINARWLIQNKNKFKNLNEEWYNAKIIEYLSNSIKLNENFAFTYYELGMFYYKLKDYRNCLPNFIKYLTFKNEQFFLNIGCFYGIGFFMKRLENVILN
jgi:hypothetical protein